MCAFSSLGGVKSAEEYARDRHRSLQTLLRVCIYIVSSIHIEPMIMCMCLGVCGQRDVTLVLQGVGCVVTVYNT